MVEISTTVAMTVFVLMIMGSFIAFAGIFASLAEDSAAKLFGNLIGFVVYVWVAISVGVAIF